MSIRKVRCIVIRIPEDQPTAAAVDIEQFEEIELPASPRRDVLPWADPYIMRLIDRCQQEARREMGLPAKDDPQPRLPSGGVEDFELPARPARRRTAKAALPRRPR